MTKPAVDFGDTFGCDFLDRPDAMLIHDMFSMLIGPKIGEGCSRAVFTAQHDPDYVVKVETRPWRNYPEFHNVQEWCTWDKATPKQRKWLAEPTRISPCGRVMIQKKTEPTEDILADLPKLIPQVFCDTKLDNWGLLDGRFVCHDYGYIGGHSWRLAKPRWWFA